MNTINKIRLFNMILFLIWAPVNMSAKNLQFTAMGTADPEMCVNQAHARIVALKTARHLAYEALAEHISGLCLECDSDYHNEIMRESRLNAEAEGFIMNAHPGSQRVEILDDGSVLATVTLILETDDETCGGLHFSEEIVQTAPTEMQRHIILEPLETLHITIPVPSPASIVPRASLPDPELPLSENAPAFDDESRQPANAKTENIKARNNATLRQKSSPFTGMILDARHLAPFTHEFPAVYSETGQPVHRLDHVELSRRQYNQPYVTYFYSMEDALTSDITGSRPLVVEVISCSENGEELIISERDAELIDASFHLNTALNTGKCIVLKNSAGAAGIGSERR